jgi:serine/threonine-protein kinase PRP4
VSFHAPLCHIVLTSLSPNVVEITEETEPLDEAALIEQRRKRREAIKAKYKGAATPMLVQALQLEDKSRSGTPGQSQSADDSVQSTRAGKPQY